MTENNVIITAIARVVLFISVASAQVHFQLKFFVGKNILLAVEEMSSSLQSAAVYRASDSQR